MSLNSKPRKLVMLASRSPVPAISGEKIKNLNLLKILSKHFEVHLICLNEKKLGEKDFQALKSHCHELTMIILPAWQRLGRLASSLLNGKPLQVNYFYSRQMQQEFDRVSKTADLVVCTLVRTAEYACDYRGPKYLDLGDSIAQNYKQSMAKTRNWLWKLIYRFEGGRLWNYECQSVGSFNKSFLFNQNEIQKFPVKEKLVWVPHGIKEFLFEGPLGALECSVGREPGKELGKDCEICFLGKMDYQPNVDAVLWFSENVMPLLPRNIRFVILGAEPSEAVQRLQERDPERIEVTGFLDDPYARMRRSVAVVAPMQTGAGIQNKVIEAMALGMVVITTARGASALEGVCSGEHLWILDDPTKMAEKIIELVGEMSGELSSHQQSRIAMAEKARTYVQGKFTWQAFEKVWMDTISGSISRSNSRSN